MTWQELKKAMDDASTVDSDRIALRVDGDEHDIECVRVEHEYGTNSHRRVSRVVIVAKPDF